MYPHVCAAMRWSAPTHAAWFCCGQRCQIALGAKCVECVCWGQLCTRLRCVLRYVYMELCVCVRGTRLCSPPLVVVCTSNLNTNPAIHQLHVLHVSRSTMTSNIAIPASVLERLQARPTRQEQKTHRQRYDM